PNHPGSIFPYKKVSYIQIWRDGDHVPARICKNDANHWPGQQWGQLTVVSRALLINSDLTLGSNHLSILTQRTESEPFQTRHFQLHIRTVDLNRTITSATSNALGMFYDDSNLVAGLDYPNKKDWPKGYLPIPVHMIEQQTDHVRSTAPNEVLSKSNEALKSTEIVITKRTVISLEEQSSSSIEVQFRSDRNCCRIFQLLSLDSECARRRYLINDVLRKSKEFTETEQKAQVERF
ncbi:unnamed protein product, partial [Anisakis simplex]|uniref:SHR-BD domain-containing protein n=1 Tax=Anisakis simplex TaxID=6269 RepID=A0A0M3J4P2_ANISI